MKNKYKTYIKLNMVSLFFIVVSFISVTLAWFAYSGLATARTEIDVKAWYIEFDKNNEPVSNEIVISLSEIYPGMETVHEEVNIKNRGDSDASLRYDISSARILDQEYINTNDDSLYIEDKISHDYPFNVNINVDKNYVKAGNETKFDISISWPLDSDNDELDSTWGKLAYDFQTQENNKLENDSLYQVRPSIKIVINIKAEQYIEQSNISDTRFNRGDIVLYDVLNNRRCSELSSTCIKTYVLDRNNTLGDTTVLLLPNIYDGYTKSSYDNYDDVVSSLGWNAEIRSLTVDDILDIISTDILNSVLKRNNISDVIIGNLRYPGRINTELLKAVNYDGYYEYLSAEYSFITSNSCYWTKTSYNSEKAFAFVREDSEHGKVYGELKTANCGIIPVIIARKSNIIE